MLDIDWITILLEIINFGLITVVLYFLVFKPIVRRSEAQALEKARLMEELKHNHEISEINLAKINERLLNLDKEIQVITDEAYEQNKALQAGLLENTREEAKQIIQDELLELKKEQLINMKLQYKDLVGAVLSITSQSLRKLSLSAVHDSLIKGLVDEILSFGKTQVHQVQTIRNSLSGRQANVFIFAAYPLSSEQEVLLVSAINALVDTDVNVEIEIDEDLVYGAKVRIDDLIIENSLASQLEAIRDEVAESLEITIMDQNE